MGEIKETNADLNNESFCKENNNDDNVEEEETISEPENEYIPGIDDNLDENEQNAAAGWPSTTLKLFFAGLKAHGRDFDKINEFMRSRISGFNKRKCSFRFLFRRLLKKVNKNLDEFIKKNASKIPSVQRRSFVEAFLDSSTRTSLTELKMVMAYGELCCADLFSNTPLSKHIRKLYQLLSVGHASYMKSGRIFTLKMPNAIKDVNTLAPANPPQINKGYQKLPTYVLSMQRLMLEIRPKSLAVLILMKQRAFNPNIRLEIPIDLKVQDLVDKLMDYWRLPSRGLRNILTLYHLVQKEKKNFTIENENEFNVRNLVPTEYIADIQVFRNQQIQLLYDLNSQFLPDINDSLLSHITLSILSKLAKIHLSSVNRIPPENEPKISYKYPSIAPSNMSMPCSRLQHFKSSRIRPIPIPVENKTVQPPSENNEPKGKRRVIPIPLNTSKLNLPKSIDAVANKQKPNYDPTNPGMSQPNSSINDFRFRIFGSSKIDETTVDDGESVISCDNLVADSSNFSKYVYGLDPNNPNAFNDAINNFPECLLTNLNTAAISNDISTLLNKEFANDEVNISNKGPISKYSHVNLINDDSNLGFQQHFGALPPIDSNHSILVNKPFSYNNEDSMPASTTIPSGVLETPKFDTAKIMPKTPLQERSVAKKLFVTKNIKF